MYWSYDKVVNTSQLRAMSAKDTSKADASAAADSKDKVGEEHSQYFQSTPIGKEGKKKTGFFRKLGVGKGVKDKTMESIDSPRSSKRQRQQTPTDNSFKGDDSESLLSVITASELDKLIEQKVESETKVLEQRIISLEMTCESQCRDIEELQKDSMVLQQKNTLLEGRVTRAEKVIDEQREQILQIQARSMRENLVFYNIPEEKGENTKAATKETLQKFIKDEMKMKVEEYDSVEIDRAHRSGPNHGRFPRTIIAKFKSDAAKDAVLRNAKNLDRDKKFGISEQLPRELSERKKQLLPTYKEAQRQNKKPKWKVDKLVVDKAVISVEKDRIRDINVNVETVAREMKIARCPPKTYDGSSFQGHKVTIQSQDDIIPALHCIYSDTRVARATHNIYAYRIASGSGKVYEHYEDDGEFGAGLKLLTLLKNTNTENALICVTRWCGKKLLGGARFDHIHEAGSQALQQVMKGNQELRSSAEMASPGANSELHGSTYY